MTVSRAGKNWLRDQLDAGIDNVTLGTGTTSPTTSDTALETPDNATSASTTNTTGQKLVNATHILPSTTGAGTSYTEAALFVSGGTVLYDRIVFPAISHTANDDIHTTFVEIFR